MSAPPDLFHHCPRCGVDQPEPPGKNPFLCQACGLTFFFNPGVAAGVFLFDESHRTLLIRREKEPRKGMLAIPGGFIDAGETAEEGLRREVREEVGLELRELTFLCTGTNQYAYREVVYPVVDLIFAATAIEPHRASALDAVAAIEWRTIDEIDPAELAFPSIVLGWQVLRARPARG